MMGRRRETRAGGLVLARLGLAGFGRGLHRGEEEYGRQYTATITIRDTYLSQVQVGTRNITAQGHTACS